jgi:hypothetical protein
MKLFKLSLTVLIYMLLTIGCDSEDKLVVKQYEIINSETNHSYKKSVDVRLIDIRLTTITPPSFPRSRVGMHTHRLTFPRRYVEAKKGPTLWYFSSMEGLV